MGLATVTGYDELARQRCIASGAVPVIITAIRSASNRGRKGGLKVACLSLAHLALSREEGTSAILDAGGANAVVETMQKHSAITPVMDLCTLALLNMSRTDRGMSAIKDAGGAAAVHEALQAGIKVDPDLVKSLDCTS